MSVELMSVRGLSRQSASKQKPWSREHRESPSFRAGRSQTRLIVRQAMAGMWSLAYDTGYCQGWSDKGADLAATEGP
jgi:hypothetical protein